MYTFVYLEHRLKSYTTKHFSRKVMLAPPLRDSTEQKLSLSFQLCTFPAKHYQYHQYHQYVTQSIGMSRMLAILNFDFL